MTWNSTWMVASVATLGIAAQLVLHPVQKNPLPKHLPGDWAVDLGVTKQLAPDSRIAKFSNLSFTNDPNVLSKLGSAAYRLRDQSLIMSGWMTIDGNTHRYVISEKEGCSTLVWFHEGTETPVGDPVAKCVNMILASEAQNDMLFLGDKDGARNASVCYRRAGTR